MEDEVVVVLPLQVTVAPFTGSSFNRTCPCTITDCVSDDAEDVAITAIMAPSVSVYNSAFKVLLLSIDSPF
jgi:hypothetical protein